MILNKATENVVTNVLPYVGREDDQSGREAVSKTFLVFVIKNIFIAVE